jgi:beta-glucosidase-like glycosyl hydrolase
MAQDDIILLKNGGGVLPLSKTKVSSITVIGHNVSIQLGNYFGPTCISVTLLQALQGYVKDARF